MSQNFRNYFKLDLHSKNPYLIASIVVIFLYTVIVSIYPAYIHINDNVSPYGFRLLRDDEDRSVYYERAAWYREKLIPYKEVFIEYPQIAAYVFAIPDLFSEDLEKYMMFFSILMAICYVVNFYFVLKILEYLKRPYWPSVVLFFPTFLYFTLNRFDIVPVMLVSISILLFLKNKYNLSMLILGCGVMTKWYPLIIAPIILSYLYRNNQFRKSYLLLFVSPIAFFSLLTIIPGGLNAFLSPYLWHISRGYNQFSFPYLINELNNIIKLSPYPILLLSFSLFQSLSFIFPGWLILNGKEKTSLEQLFALIALSIMSFIFFAKFYSTQWVMWFYPIFLLLIFKPYYLLLLFAFDIFNYLQFPISVEFYQSHGWWFVVISILKNVLYIGLAIYLVFQNKNRLVAIGPYRNSNVSG